MVCTDLNYFKMSKYCIC